MTSTAARLPAGRMLHLAHMLPSSSADSLVPSVLSGLLNVTLCAPMKRHEPKHPELRAHFFCFQAKSRQCLMIFLPGMACGEKLFHEVFSGRKLAEL